MASLTADTSDVEVTELENEQMELVLHAVDKREYIVYRCNEDAEKMAEKFEDLADRIREAGKR